MTKRFLVKHKGHVNTYWIDINSGRKFERLKGIPYEEAQHGLCETLGKLVLKKVVDDGSECMIFIAKDKVFKEPYQRRITVQYKEKIRNVQFLRKWTFEPYELSETVKYIDEDKNDKEISLIIGTPKDAIKVLRSKLTDFLFDKILGGDNDGGHDTKRGSDNTTRFSYHLRY